MKVKLALALPEELEMTGIEILDEVLTITLVSTQGSPCCPICGTPTTRVHSCYTRQMADLPCGGQRMRLLVLVRKCFCKVTTCARKNFTERLTSFVEPWARVTRRLYQIVQVIGLATGGRLGVRVTDRLGIQTTRHTILRRIMALPTEPVGQVPQIGIDDFSFRRGRKFGTIVVDLQTHKVLDVLPDRTADTSAAWMQEHSEIEIVSRDRGGDYAAVARKAAPQATQVADRFHILKNLTEAVELALAGCRAEIRQNAAAITQKEVSHEAGEALVESPRFVAGETWKPVPDACDVRASLARRAQRYDQYQQVTELHAQGFRQEEIAERSGVSARTIQRWLKAGTFPERKQRRKQPSTFDPYAAYVLKRWEQGCRNGLQIYAEIKAQGYKGSPTVVGRYILALREQQQVIRDVETPAVPLQDFSAKEVVWLFVRDRSKLDEKEQVTLAVLC